MNTDQKAAWAARLRANEDFQKLMKEFHDEAIADFVNSRTPEDREEAHAMLRAEMKLEGTLHLALSNKTFEDNKDQHRAND